MPSNRYQNYLDKSLNTGFGFKLQLKSSRVSYLSVQRRIPNPVKHLRWRFLGKYFPNANPNSFHRVLNMPMENIKIKSILHQ